MEVDGHESRAYASISDKVFAEDRESRNDTLELVYSLVVTVR